MFKARRGRACSPLAMTVTITNPAMAASAAESTGVRSGWPACMPPSPRPPARQPGQACSCFEHRQGRVSLRGAVRRGALRVHGKTAGYYNTAAASYGLQAGVQAFGYALFFMSDSARDYLSKSGGFELGTGPSIVVLDAGTAKAFTTTTLQNDIYAVFFDQKGLMAGLGLQGSKISRIEK